jgi:hemoglobin-like flavoprotein
MADATNARSREHLSQSLSLVKQRKDDIAERIEANLQSHGAQDEAYGQSEMVASVLLELLLEEAATWIERGEVARLPGLAEEHESLGISGRHYSRFGDLLVPVLKDLIGLPSPVAASWCDLFWRAIRSVQDERALAHA